MSAYFAPLVSLPVVIDAPGTYVTRCGGIVEIVKTPEGPEHAFNCVGVYDDPHETREFWHKSGRLYATFECENDIVRKEA